MRKTAITGGTGVLRLGRQHRESPGTDRRVKAKEDNHEHYHQFGALDRDLGRQRLAQLGVLPSGAGPKAQMSRASVPFLSLK